MTDLKWQGIAGGVLGVVCLVAGIASGNATYILVGIGVVVVVGAVLALQSRAERD